MMHAADGVSFTTGTPFSALGDVRLHSSHLVDVVGLGLWIHTVLTALSPALRCERSSERSSRSS